MPSDDSEAPIWTNSKRRSASFNRGSVGWNEPSAAGVYGRSTVGTPVPASVGDEIGCTGGGGGAGTSARGARTGGGGAGTEIRVPSRRETLGSSIASGSAGCACAGRGGAAAGVAGPGGVRAGGVEG